MKITGIIIWLLMFVVGSLIVIFITQPHSFEVAKDNLKQLNPELNGAIYQGPVRPTDNETYSRETGITKSKYIKLIPSEMDEYSQWSIYKSCAAIETLGETQGVYDLKEKGCREACGKRNLNYYSTSCEKDLYACFCY